MYIYPFIYTIYIHYFSDENNVLLFIYIYYLFMYKHIYIIHRDYICTINPNRQQNLI